MSKKVVLCAGCGQVKSKMTSEHFWPQWLIKKTKTNNTGVKSVTGKKIPPSAFTIPLCKECNDDFGKYLELPVSNVFDDLESNRGISDFEAELLVRWLWKLEGLHWTLVNPINSYSPSYKLRERVLLPIDKIRPSLILAISLIEEIDSSYGDAPLGLDSFNRANAIFVAGVFSRIAIMVLHQNFMRLVPQNFSQYNLADTLDVTSHQKIFFPQIGFKDDTDAVAITLDSSQALSKAHDVWVVSIKQNLEENDEA